jgi:hypothetical protein
MAVEKIQFRVESTLYQRRSHPSCASPIAPTFKFPVSPSVQLT